MKDNIFLNIIKNSGVQIAEELPTTKFIDTGTYMLNALLSGSIYGGIPSNRITAFCGVEGSGKTFYALSVAKNFLENNPDSHVVYFDTEFALEKTMLEKRGINSDRVTLLQPNTLQEFRTDAIKIIDGYESSKEKPPILFVLDSLGNLSTTKEIEDSTAGKETRDMTRAQVVKSIFRILTQKLGRNQIPLIVTNHVYDAVGAYVPTKEISGGCLAAGTKVLMGDKTFKNIEDIALKDIVQTKIGPREVINIWNKDNLEDPNPECFEIEFEDGLVIKCSENHKFLVNGKWVEARELLKGMDLEKI